MNEDSILDSTKKILGLGEGYYAFDLDVITAINSALGTLGQVGVGPDIGFEISSSAETWDHLLGGDHRLNLVRSFVFLSCRLEFDPPQTSFAIASMQKQLDEKIWRIRVLADPAPLATDEDLLVPEL